MEKMEKLRETNKLLSGLLIDLETQLFIENHYNRKLKKEVKQDEPSIYE